VAEQRYQAVMAVIGDGLSMSQAAEKTGVSRRTLHTWLARYEAEGLEGLKGRSRRPASCPHQMPVPAPEPRVPPIPWVTPNLIARTAPSASG
jgi:transposase-like protein